ncbi:MAG: DUF4384 domain-containing protein [Nitrospirae bacterium]|nr:DUF4384 domain-containing protein [Nitrospirota bacterium]
MKRILLTTITVLLFAAAFNPAGAEDATPRIVKDVQAEGACAIVGMSAEQSQLLALQRARMAAIEQAAGVRLTSTTIVTNDRLAVDFIRAYAKGFIVNEKAEWLPLGQYQKDKSTPPVPEYKVKITADVYTPFKKIKPLGLTAQMNENTFRNGEKGLVKIRADRDVKLAIFNITADDKVVMLFPNQYDRNNAVSGRETFVFPPKDSQIELEIQTLPGHTRDAEAIFVAVMDGNYAREFMNIFNPLEPMGFAGFFAKYSEIADYCEDVIMAYEVTE